MTPAHVLPLPSALSARLRAPPPVLVHGTGRSVASGVILALILLAVLLQASFFVGLASGRPGGPDAGSPPRASLAR